VGILGVEQMQQPYAQIPNHGALSFAPESGRT